MVEICNTRVPQIFHYENAPYMGRTFWYAERSKLSGCEEVVVYVGLTKEYFGHTKVHVGRTHKDFKP